MCRNNINKIKQTLRKRGVRYNQILDDIIEVQNISIIMIEGREPIVMQAKKIIADYKNIDIPLCIHISNIEKYIDLMHFNFAYSNGFLYITDIRINVMPDAIAVYQYNKKLIDLPLNFLF